MSPSAQGHVGPREGAVRERAGRAQKGANISIAEEFPQAALLYRYDPRSHLIQPRAMTERPIRTIHHLASSGGTIISRCLAAMPSVVLLSEVHPLEVRPNVFNPYDPLQEFLGRYGGLAMSEADVAAVFSERIRLIAERCEQEDRTLVLRDHSHADFFMGAPYGPRLLASLRDVRPVTSVVTVRDPLDMFLSMRASGFIPAETDFETVCGHYLAFLDTYAKVTCFRYEDFARDPDAWLAEFADISQFLTMTLTGIGLLPSA